MVHESVCWNVSGNVHKTFQRTFLGTFMTPFAGTFLGTFTRRTFWLQLTTFTRTFCSEDIIQVCILVVLAFHNLVHCTTVHDTWKIEIVLSAIRELIAIYTTYLAFRSCCTSFLEHYIDSSYVYFCEYRGWGAVVYLIRVDSGTEISK